MNQRFDITIASENAGQPPVTPQVLWRRMSSSREFTAFEQIVEARLAEMRAVYEANDASEFNRGRVVEIKTLLNFLRTGDYA